MPRLGRQRRGCFWSAVLGFRECRSGKEGNHAVLEDTSSSELPFRLDGEQDDLTHVRRLSSACQADEGRDVELEDAMLSDSGWDESARVYKN